MTARSYAQKAIAQAGQRTFRSRFEPCINLSNGEIEFPITRIDPLFEELPLHKVAVTSPAGWLALTLRRLAHCAREFEVGVRPLHAPVPYSIFSHDRGPDLCLQAVTAEEFCPQEFILEFQDASLAATEDDVLDKMEAYRRKGFRIGLDARTSSAAPFGARLRSAVERIRVCEEDLLTDETVQMRAEIVSSLGGNVILDRAHWKRADLLVSYGATHSLKMITDA